MAKRGALVFAAAAGRLHRRRPADGDAETRRHPDLHDPGRTAPPSFDAHREETYATIHSARRSTASLIHVDPNDPSVDRADWSAICAPRCRSRPTTARPTPSRSAHGVKFHDGTPLTAADVAASWNKIIFPPEGVASARQSNFVMVDKVEAPDPTTVVFRLKFATDAFLPALADPYAWIYSKAKLDKDPHWYEKNIEGSGPFKFVAYDTGQSIKGERNPDYYHKGLPYLDGFSGIFRRQAGDAGRRDPRRPRGDRVSRLAALGARRAGRCTRRPDHGTDQRLELRRLADDQPQEKAVRRSPRAPRADPGDRPLGERAGSVEDRDRADGRRDHLSRFAARRDQGGAAAARRLLAGYREIARRGASGC